jgi:hypothetical protein
MDKRTRSLYVFVCLLGITSIALSTTDTTTDVLLPQNEPLVKEMYIADPSAHVFEDKLYIYPFT